MTAPVGPPAAAIPAGGTEPAGTQAEQPSNAASFAHARPARVDEQPEPEPVVYPFSEPLPTQSLPKTAAAMQSANLAPWQCRKEMARRGLPVQRHRGAAPGVATPLRLADELAGVRFVAPGARSPYGLLDCRLLLVLDDWSRMLSEEGIAQVRVDNMYRPRAHLPGSRKRSQHAYGLAIDVLAFTRSDGTELVVERDWGAGIGSIPCGPEATLDNATAEALAIRKILCRTARMGFFHHVLTPSYDAAHGNHLHLDIKRDEKRLLVR